MHDNNQISLIEKSIENFGFINPIIIDENNRVLDCNLVRILIHCFCIPKGLIVDPFAGGPQGGFVFFKGDPKKIKDKFTTKSFLDIDIDIDLDKYISEE